MNNDLISREALKKDLFIKFGNQLPISLLDEIDNAPTVEEPLQALARIDEKGNIKIEPLRLKGEWLKKGAYYDERAHLMFDKCRCSICGVTQTFYEDCETGALFSFEFCPNCGAKMLGGDDNGSDRD